MATLQARIREGNEERAALRSQLAAATGGGLENNDSAAGQGSAAADSDDGDEGVPAAHRAAALDELDRILLATRSWPGGEPS